MSSGRGRRAREWCDANNNAFKLTAGRIVDGCILFHVQRRRGAHALTFDLGERLWLCHRGEFYDAEVSAFTPRSRCGSVIAASGLLVLVRQEDIAQALRSTPRKLDSGE
jgi:hypothetical protein